MTLNQKIIIAGLCSCALWAILVPIWHFPDEQAHFAQVQNYAEIGSSPKESNDLSLEIYESEKILGTLRDTLGRNKYTYSPSYTIPYAVGTIGFEEEFINTLPVGARTQLVKEESPRYPPLFYIISAFGYKLTYNNALFTRVIATRAISVLLFASIVLATSKFSQILFSKNELLQTATTLLVAFHPMLTFVSAGINNDTLLNLISVILFYLLLIVVDQGLTPKTVFFIGATFAFGTLTKQLIFLLVPTILLVFIIGLVNKRPKKQTFIKMAFLFIASLSLMIVLKQNQGFWLPFWPNITPNSPGAHFSTVSLLKERVSQLYRETLPWYWGVFKWLGIVLPLPVIRSIKLVMLISFSGLLKYIFEILRVKKITPVDKKLLILFFANITYISILLIWDISLTRSMGFAHGLQGRYFFPLIVTHMGFLAFGLWQWAKNYQFKKLFPAIIGIAIIGLNLIALHRVLSSYYDFSSTVILINQISQYKPPFAKWPYLLVYLAIYIFAMYQLIVRLLMGEKKQ